MDIEDLNGWMSLFTQSTKTKTFQLHQGDLQQKVGLQIKHNQLRYTELIKLVNQKIVFHVQSQKFKINPKV